MGKMIDNYSLQECLGEGVYAKVYRAIHVKTHQQVAIKVIQSSKFRDIPKLEECTVNQINILSQLKEECDYIIKYIDMLKTANNFYFVYQFCNGGSLDVLLKKEGPLAQKKAIEFLRQILDAFRLLSKNNIMHRDLKPENILIHNGSLKLADFGFCKPLEHKNDLAHTMLGSPIYMAPEVLKGQIYTLKADIWSMGVVFYQMLFGKCPFESKSIAMLIKQLQVQNLYIPQHPKISASSQQFLRRVLVKDHNQRISWDQIFNTYHISSDCEIINKKQLVIFQQSFGGQLRSSMKSNSGGTYPNGSMRISLPYNSLSHTGPITSPKSALIPVNGNNNTNGHAHFNRSYDGNQNSMDQNGLALRKSPNKPNLDPRGTFQYGSRVASNIQGNTATTSATNSTANSGSYPNHSSHVKTQANSNGNSNAKVQRPTRVDILLKNHMKSLQIHQLVLDIYALDQKFSHYIAYFVFKNVCKEIQSLYDNLKKQSTSDNFPTPLAYREFRSAVQAQMEYSQSIVTNFSEVLMEQQTQHKVLGAKMKNSGTLLDEINQNKQKIMRMYIENVKDTDEDVRLAAQVVDYLQEFILIKKDAYERMGRDHLLRQMRNKMLKY